MKYQVFHTRKRIALTLFVTLLTCSCWLPAQDRIEKYFVGIELKDVLCGYSEVFVTPPETTLTHYLTIDQKTFISFRALGQDISQKQLFTYRLDPTDGNFTYHDS